MARVLANFSSRWKERGLKSAKTAEASRFPSPDPSAPLPPKKKRSHKVVIRVEHVDKYFKIGPHRQRILKDIDLAFYSGEFAIIFGPSGCGKSTLLHIILGLERPERGRAFLRERSLYQLSDDERAGWRREKVGMVFQQSNWIKSLNVQENVAYPLYLAGMADRQVKERAAAALAQVGMERAAGQNPAELSGGEQQKAALARALAADPGIIVADEPTGNLDSRSGRDLMGLLARLNREERKMVLMVTHDASFLPLANRRVWMRDGRIVKDEHD